jgi:AmiR/NasT family two-component response regulator
MSGTPDPPIEPGAPAARVVVAEDEGIIRLDLVETLREDGYDVVGECARGDEVMAMIRSMAPDVLICDI